MDRMLSGRVPQHAHSGGIVGIQRQQDNAPEGKPNSQDQNESMQQAGNWIVCQRATQTKGSPHTVNVFSDG